MPGIEFILAGFEQGGTTLLSDLFRANGFESGFEGGVLLAESPAEMHKFSPYWDNLLTGWGITSQQREMAALGDFEQFYDHLINAAFPSFSGRFFDKTPKYMERLGACLNRAPFLRGAVVIHRDPRAVFYSMARKIAPELSPHAAVRRHFDHLSTRYLSYFSGCIAHIDNPKVLFVAYEDLVRNQNKWLKRIGSFVHGDTFKPRITVSRFSQVIGSCMEVGKAFEYKHAFDQGLQDQILSATARAALFFDDSDSRAMYLPVWRTCLKNTQSVLGTYELPAINCDIAGERFDPLTYLIRYPDVLHAKSDPVKHYVLHGKQEGRLAC